MAIGGAKARVNMLNQKQDSRKLAASSSEFHSGVIADSDRRDWRIPVSACRYRVDGSSLRAASRIRARFAPSRAVGTDAQAPEIRPETLSRARNSRVRRHAGSFFRMTSQSGASKRSTSRARSLGMNRRRTTLFADHPGVSPETVVLRLRAVELRDPARPGTDPCCAGSFTRVARPGYVSPSGTRPMLT